MNTLLTIIIIAVLAWILYRIFLALYRQGPILPASLRNADVVYLDNNNKKVFASDRYRIKGKPDAIIRMPDKTIGIIEYKSRSTRIYDSDRKQLIATALAVRETYPELKHGYIVLQNGTTEHIDLTGSDESLHTAIKSEYQLVQSALHGIAPAFTPVKYKCHNCGVRHGCNDAA